MDLAKILRAQWDRAAAILALAFGVLALVLGYVGVSSTAYTAEQLPYLVSGGITGVFLLGVGATLYLSADIRDEWRKLDDLERKLTAAEEHIPACTDLERRLAAIESRLADPAPRRSTRNMARRNSAEGEAVPAGAPNGS